MSLTESKARACTDGADEEALRMHALAPGKVQMLPRCAVRDFGDFAVWYTPGVAAPCRAIRDDRERVYEFTSRGSTVAIISDGTRVLGLGDIGPEAALPVMEGKALLFKYLGGVDAIPLCLDAKDPDELVRAVEILAPSFGGINLEDIASPKCFRILEALRTRLEIPVWHDDQQGSAAVALAALTNALHVVGKSLGSIRIALIGAGAAGVATCRLLQAAGADAAAIVVCDSIGILHEGRTDIRDNQERFAEKWRICQVTNGDGLTGGTADALRGADACISFAQCGPDVIRPEWVGAMNRDAIVFACANPVPEIWPRLARDAGARVVGTGRSDFPNQVNNALIFPGLFRGTLEVRARAITDEMAVAAAYELAACAAERGLDEQAILPRMDDPEVAPRIAAAAAMKAQEYGLARRPASADEVRVRTAEAISQAREATQLLVREHLVPSRDPSSRAVAPIMRDREGPRHRSFE